jgi:hypothetical protein
LDVWLLLAEGSGLGLVGVWLLVSRPRDWGARFFFTACLGIVVAASGAGLLSLYLVQPRRLIGPFPASILIGLAGGWGAACGWGLLPLRAFYGELLVSTAGFLIVLITQWCAVGET